MKHNMIKKWLHAGDLNTPTNIHDSKSAYTLAAMLAVVSPWIRCIYADRGYRGKFIEKAKHDFRMGKIVQISSNISNPQERATYSRTLGDFCGKTEVCRTSGFHPTRFQKMPF